MNKSGLLEVLERVPSTAMIYIEADHGQSPERAGGFLVTDTTDNLPFNGEDIMWVVLDEYEGYDDEITAVLIM